MKEGIDAIDTRQSDLDFQVSTNASSVRDFLDAPFGGTKIVFSTYQSAQVVGAALKPGEAFDLAVFDEAHKTAGREGRNYAFALEDANLPILKRLFLTATPRHYNPHQHDREGDAQLVFSMDRPEVYGPQAFLLTFGEASRREIICGYKVIISVITSEMVTNELLSRGEVLVSGDAVRARQVANQIALCDAIEKYDVKKVFTFHSTVKSADSFVADGPEGVGTHLADVAADVRRLTSKPASEQRKDQSPVTSAATSGFQTFHVNGTMPTARREREMRDFRAAARAVMSNARCLTEGIDVPAVDMVAFLSPRRSRVDIVQATGRAMRRSPRKTTGYVLVPLYVELAAGETVEAAVNRAEFDEVWDVLQSMQEQDDVLAEIIREMREERGRTKGFDDSRLRERIEVLGPQVALEFLYTSITAECIERLGVPWEERYGELRAFKERFGHCNVPDRWTDHPKLYGWTNAQRQFHKAKRLSETRIHRLTDLGFIFDPQEAAWEEMYYALSEFKRIHGDCNVPRPWPDNPQLTRWVTKQRSNQRERRLTKERSERLNAIGFVWEPADSRWEENFRAVVQFQRTHGAAWIRLIRTKAPGIATWLSTQRLFRRKGMLTEERIFRLEKIGIEWNPLDSAWEEMFRALCAFKEKLGHCAVPSILPEKPRLRQWTIVQRSFKRHNRLSANRVSRLEELGFIWDPHEAAWEELFQRFLTHRRIRAECNVDWSGDPALGSWVRTQRTKRKLNKLRDDRIRRLDAAGFLWNPQTDAWEQMFRELVEYQERHGDCNVPIPCVENPELGRWVHVQRVDYKTGRLAEERVRRLDAKRFQWDPRDDWWEQSFAKLVDFKNKHSHCEVSRNDPQYAKLAFWINSQRTDCRKGKVPGERVRRLTKLGLSWNPKTDLWDQRFSDLVEFKKEHGHCLVPSKWRRDRKLLAWVWTQRLLRTRGQLSEDRIQRLEAEGFVWNSKDAAWEAMFAELVKFRKIHLHCDVPQGWAENPKLAAWVNAQRLRRRKGQVSRLTLERIRRLDELGFRWEMKRSKRFQHPTDTTWTSS